MSISPSDLFEIGLIAPNPKEAIERFHKSSGYTFSPILEGVLPTRDREEGDSVPPYRMVVSREWPELESIEMRCGEAA